MHKKLKARHSKLPTLHEGTETLTVESANESDGFSGVDARDASASEKRMLSLTFLSDTKSDKSKDWEKEEWRELDKEPEHRPPTSDRSVYRDETQDDP